MLTVAYWTVVGSNWELATGVVAQALMPARRLVLFRFWAAIMAWMASRFDSSKTPPPAGSFTSVVSDTQYLPSDTDMLAAVSDEAVTNWKVITSPGATATECAASMQAAAAAVAQAVVEVFRVSVVEEPFL